MPVWPVGGGSASDGFSGAMWLDAGLLSTVTFNSATTAWDGSTFNVQGSGFTVDARGNLVLPAGVWAFQYTVKATPATGASGVLTFDPTTLQPTVYRQVDAWPLASSPYVEHLPTAFEVVATTRTLGLWINNGMDDDISYLEVEVHGHRVSSSTSTTTIP